MKITDKNKPIKTIPKGVWEAEHPINDKNKTEYNSKLNPSTDLQGNGYPNDNKK